MRRLNFGFLAALVAVVAVFGGSMHLVHGFQLRRNATALLERARRAEKGHELEKAEQSLSEYLSIRREDGAVWAWYARLLDQQGPERTQSDRVFLVHERALRHNPGDSSLARRCADLALELGRFSDALRHFTALLEQLPSHSEVEQIDAARAQLEDLLGQCERGSSRFAHAEQFLVKAIEHDPRRVSSYDRLARLLRTDLRRNDSADRTVKEMVARNPKSGLAYAYRWRYARAYSRSADPMDIQQAVKLAPHDPGVLLIAAEAFEQKPDTAVARTYYEKGFTLDPKNQAFALGLANLERREKHLERAEQVLRQAMQAKPSVALAFELADTLILQNKIDGKEGAAFYMSRLRSAGLGDSLVRFLEAELPFQAKDWARAIPKLESARETLRSEPQLSARLNLMLAECYGRTGSQEKSLGALRNAAQADNGSDSVRVELARAVARTGKVDEALGILSPLAERQPELKLEIVRLLIEKTLRLPPNQRVWREIDARVTEAQKTLPEAFDEVIALRADLLLLQGRLDAAKEILERAIEKNPKSVNTRIALATLLQGRQDMTGATMVLDRAEKELGSSTALIRARLRFWSERPGAEAKKAINMIADARSSVPAPEQPRFLDDLAMALYRANDLNRASEIWQEASRLQPENLDILRRRADLALAAGDRPAVEEIVRKMRTVEGDQGTSWRYVQAIFLIDEASRGDSKNVEYTSKAVGELVGEILTRRPDWWGGFVVRGRLAELAGREEDAVRDYLQATDSGANQPGLARRLLVLLYQRKQFDEFDQVLQKLRDRGAAPADLTLATAMNALRRKEFDRAAMLARSAIPSESKTSSDLLILANILMSSGQKQDAEKCLNRALELDPAAPDSWLGKVRFLLESDRKHEVPRVLEQATIAVPKHRAATMLAACYAMLGDDEQATRFIESALAMNPDDPPTLRAAAEYYVKILNLGKAEPLIAKLLDPNFKGTATYIPWARRAQCLIFMQSGDHRQLDNAIRLVDQNLKDNPHSFEDQRSRAILISMTPKRALEAIHQLEALDRARLLTIPDRFLLAKLYRQTQEPSKCEAQILGLVQEQKPQAEHLAYLVALLLDQGRLDQAERWLAASKAVDRNQEVALLELKSRLLKARKRDAELVALLREYASLHGDQIGAVADLFDRYGKLADAERAYRDYVAQNKKEPERVLALARFLGRHDRVEEALRVCSDAWKNCPPEQVAATSLEVLSSARIVTDERRQRVDSSLSKALKLKPSSTAIRLSLASLRSVQGRYDEAESIYREMLSATPDNLRALNSLAWLLAFRTGKESEALQFVDRAIDIAGSNPTLFDTRAVINLRLGKIELARQDLDAALAINPEKPVLYFHLAHALEMSGDTAQAFKALRQAEQRGLNVETIDPREQELFLRVRQKLRQS